MKKATFVFLFLTVVLPSQLFAQIETAKNLAERKMAVEDRMKNEEAFIKRIQLQIDSARQALTLGKDKAETDLKNAYLYFETASKIARVGIALNDGAIPATPSDEANLFWTTATAFAGVERLKGGMESYRSYEDFLVKYASNEYQNEINELVDKLKKYKERNLLPLSQTLSALNDRLSVVGTWKRTKNWMQLIGMTLNNDGKGTLIGESYPSSKTYPCYWRYESDCLVIRSEYWGGSWEAVKRNEGALDFYDEAFTLKR